MVDRVIVLLGESADLLEGVHTTLVAAVAGTSRSRYEQVAATFAEARRDNAELLDECARLRAGIDVVLARVVAVVGDGALPPAAEDRVRAVRRELRPGVRGARAAGWWLHPDGSRTRVLSGRDSDPNSWQQRAERFLRREFPR
ncbi:hypothetical protein [Saccharothrix lopnurensis]|uniref:Uncharacterized protein n=1 Tax=Saccharothrix lopnurensis TaxID=1670621 RepID=A0ABW1PBM2_9PSEU